MMLVPCYVCYDCNEGYPCDGAERSVPCETCDALVKLLDAQDFADSLLERCRQYINRNDQALLVADLERWRKSYKQRVTPPSKSEGGFVSEKSGG